MSDDEARMTLTLTGHVQGVGMRWWVMKRMDELGLVGSATNLPDRSVVVVARGPRPALADLHRSITDGRSPGRVTNLRAVWDPPPT
ncbi:MAG TPA: acylphosphatase [Actinotalea sp.]|jgi:acylphosphatase